MEQIVTKKGLIEGLRNVLSVVTLARKSYETDILAFKNPEIKSTIEKIKNDKEKHIALLKELIAFLEDQTFHP